ncbi:DUF4397 domain-containing protein [Vibrio cyclitrophicus]|uniref:DUF4397 domain-containing protein n=1 Tax=Vibrio cyclitrophicus ZF270 TaxID=1136176 RepID=A0AAN0LLS6_9VIBR|nr:DUF4397 domain-containing protein [Vibrio cyclitrophicus]NOH20765.1 DUF4397 domain-containing protein [Vibrio cyclitrophicus]OBT19052.1 2-dehydropantoate 2-reductase [Vibrio cyclitrophicus]OCH51755.1 2-dehydropantoate 2-reductase [Vibrio cyclitrophicus]OEF35596.1 2-dehydropantoate 2-reductase [Vibrio cyclitrophicus 1F97]OEF42683.1 2-dehydropantoate 2-reductase [Vibrio cyclitrophicus 1F273]
MKYSPILAVAISALFIVGCNDDDEPTTQIQAVHASPDAPLANVLINSQARWTGVDYANASGYTSVTAGQTSVQVDVQLPGDAVLTVLPQNQFELSSDTDYTVMVVGDADGSNNPVEALVVTRPASGTATSSSLDVQVVHAASDVGDVNLYVTGPSDPLGTPLGTLGYKDFTDVLNIPAGQYRVRLETVSGSAIAFDSGEITLSGGSELTIAAVPRADSNSASPVKLMVMDGKGSSLIYDMAETAEVRVGHLVDGAPNVDVYVNSTQFAPLDDLMFKEVRGFLDLAAGSYDIDIYETATTSPTFIDVDGLAVFTGMDYSVYAVGTVSNLNLEALVVPENRRPVATSAVLNITHAAANPIAALVDIYLTENVGISGSTPALSNVKFKDYANGIYVAAGSYYVTITVAGDPTTVAIDSAPATLADGVVYQVVAIDDVAGMGFNLLVSDTTD